MKKYLMFSLLVTAIAGCVDGAEPELFDEGRGGDTLGERQAAITPSEEEKAIVDPSIEVARVRLFFGEHVYRVSQEQDPDSTRTADTVTLLESSTPDSAGQLRLLSGDRSPLEVFLDTTASTVPVPRVLVSTEPSSAVRARAAGRTLVPALTAPVAGLPASALLGQTTPMGAAASYCSGGTSASWAANVCTLTNWDVDYCHNGTWYSVTDGVGSSNKKRNSRGYTLGCGANGRVRHYYKLGGVWHKPIDEATPSGTIIRSTKNGGWALQREITHSRTASGFVRASSHFNVPF